MKFLCGNCKAKYQIGDEKVSGRTLRMRCRRCGHDILIDGHGMAPAASPPRRTGGSSVSVLPGPPRSGAGMPAAVPPRPAPPPRAPSPTRSKPPPSPLSTEFRRHVAAPPAVPQRSAPYDLWHAAIQDVPVGPMTRDELARKVESGAVTASSLCWREGMDDWRPLGELAELQGLLRRTHSVRPGKAPPAVPSPVGARHPSFFPEGVEEIDDDGSEPTRIADVTGASRALTPAPAAPVPHSKIAVPSPPPAPVPAAPPVVDAVPQAAMPAPVAATLTEPARRKQGMSGTTGVVVGLLAAFALMGGPLVWQKLNEEPQKVPVTQVAIAPVKPVEAKAPELAVPEPEANPTPTPEPQAKKPRGGGGPKGPVEPTKPSGAKLSAEEQKLLERMGGAGPDINTKQAGGLGTATAPSGPALTASQLMKVVQDNKPALQRCYETALRAVGGKQDDTIKIQVEVTVGGSGIVSDVRANGEGLGDMKRCLTASVKRWRFPQSGGESAFAFPLVFQPGA